MANFKPVWKPRIIYRGLATRTQMRAALGPLSWGKATPASYIARIWRICEQRNALAEHILPPVGGVPDPQYTAICACLPRYAPFVPLRLPCSIRWLCPFCFARSAGYTWNVLDRTLFKRVDFAPASEYRHELADRVMVYRTVLGPLISLRSTTGPKSLKAWLARRKLERKQDFRQWQTQRVKTLLEVIAFPEPLDRKEIRPEIRQLVFATPRAR